MLAMWLILVGLLGLGILLVITKKKNESYWHGYNWFRRHPMPYIVNRDFVVVEGDCERDCFDRRCADKCIGKEESRECKACKSSCFDTCA